MNEPLEPNSRPTIIIQQPSSRLWIIWSLFLLLMFSGLLNLLLIAAFADYMGTGDPPHEKFHSGEKTAKDKIARLDASSTIMPPFSTRLMESIDKIQEDDDIKGVLLVIDSPGGLVADSHQIYHKLKTLSETKPVIVQMKRLAASGGYYIAMGGGPNVQIFAEPTTWTGSIGVIIPRYDVTGLAEKVGVESDSLTTGPLKDSLNPFKKMSEAEQEVWSQIMDDAFVRFLEVIDEGRPKLDMEQIRKLATGQVYTSRQALQAGLVDQIGYEEDALEALKTQLGLTDVRVVEYQYPSTLVETLLGAGPVTPNVTIDLDPLDRLLKASVPRPMYLFGWQQGLSSSTY